MNPNPKGVMEKNNALMMKMDKKREGKRVAMAKKMSPFEKQHGGKYCDHCASSSHKTADHSGQVKSGKISR